MNPFRLPRPVFACVALYLLSACEAESSPSRSPAAGASDSGNAGASGSLGVAPASSGGASGGAAPAATAYLPARIRRLSNAEYDASVQTLLGTDLTPSVRFAFPPDARQGPTNSPAGPAFSVNDAQRVDPVLADKLDTAAQALVAEARANGKLAALSPCTDSAGRGGQACAKSFVETFGAKAYRRALNAEEIDGLVSATNSVYRVGAADAYADGIDLVTRVLLQSVGFLYVTELGDAPARTSVTLTANEIATSLSYLLTASPPDDALLAASSSLAQPDVREAQARRLLATSAGRVRLVRVVREWLGIDNVAQRDKATSVYPDFASVSLSMEKESNAFIDEVLNNSTGTLAELLTADWTVVDAPLAAVYGVTSGGPGKRTSLSAVKRRGILNQAAFLSVFASNNGSHPVFRGVAIMRRLACLTLPDPSTLGIVVSFPAADTSKTTRARFEAHEKEASCAGCHKTIDAFGFTLENFDGMGRARTSENNLPLDTSVSISMGTDFDGSYADSNAFASALAQSTSVKTCFARQIFRSVAGRSDPGVQDVENGFVDVWKQLPVPSQSNLKEVLLAYVRSSLFIQRGAP